MAAKLGGWLIYAGIVAGILYIGWNQPLRYRFLSQQEIQAIEQTAASPDVTLAPLWTAPPAPPAPPSAPAGHWMFGKDGRTRLEKGPSK